MPFLSKSHSSSFRRSTRVSNVVHGLRNRPANAYAPMQPATRRSQLAAEIEPLANSEIERVPDVQIVSPSRTDDPELG